MLPYFGGRFTIISRMKPFLPVDEQVQKLQVNGLSLGREDLGPARQLLLDHNYYRLSGYFRYFQVDPRSGKNRFTSQSTFEQIRTAYELDLKLAEHLRRGLAEFEVVFRSQLAYYMAKSSGPDSYLEERIYADQNGARSRLLADIARDLKQSEERFVRHHDRRGETLPVWAAVEVMSLGTTSKMYGLVRDSEGVFRPVAARFGISHRASRPIFRSMTVLRNVCAHHSRIWNRDDIKVEAPRETQTGKDRTIYKDTPWAWIWTLGYIVDKVRNDESYSDSLWDFIDGTPDWFVEGLTHPSDK